MALIYHITTAAEWAAAQTKGAYEAASLPLEGFIHLSREDQVAGVLERYYAGQSGLVKLTVDTAKLSAHLRYELAPSVNEEFPHLYGPLNLDAVVTVETL
ncbi:MAG: hypothetical protein JWP88_359 [Flaviaesturariibacter sp.]|nr:hypothetical protein [Flaviaesturariibacter sp.]